MAVLLVAALVFQFRLARYVPGVYWLAVVLISVFGTLITDNLTDHFGVPLEVTTVVFGVALVAWYASDTTLSIHTIVTSRREGFYWLTILFTFSLGTAAGDLTAERRDLGYSVSAVLYGAMILLVAIAHFRFRVDAITAFWIAYVLTHPLGASLGDLLSQSRTTVDSAWLRR